MRREGEEDWSAPVGCLCLVVMVAVLALAALRQWLWSA